jgi:hypothetical protein
MAQLDQEAVGGAVRRFEAERTRGMARLADRLDEQGALRAGVTAAEAADLLWVLTSFDSFDLLFTGRGLSVAAAAELLASAAEQSLLR